MGKRFEGDMIYNQFPKLFKEFFNIEYSLSDYRDWAVAIMREYISPEYYMFQGGDTIGDKMGQHGSMAAQRYYATLHEGLPDASPDLLWHYDQFCMKWQDIMGVGGNPPPAPLKLIRKQVQARSYFPAQVITTPGSTVVNTTPGSSSVPTSSDIAQTLQLILAKVSNLEERVNNQNASFGGAIQTLRQEIKDDLKSTLAEGLATLHRPGLFNTAPMDTSLDYQPAVDDLDDLYTNDQDFNMERPTSPNVITEGTALQKLCDILGDENANWKSDEQKETVMETLAGQRNLVSVMKTGGGKSMTWILAALLQSVVTVVVVPFKRLLDQHLERALSHGCKAIKWTAKMGTFGNNNLIFMALESAASFGFQK